MENSKPPPTNTYQNVLNYFNPTVLIIIGIVIVVYVVIIFALGKSNQNEDATGLQGITSASTSTSMTTIIIIVIIVIVLVGLFVYKGLPYVYGYNFSASLKNVFTKTPEFDIYMQKQPPPTPVTKNTDKKEQVFNIPGNYYTYPDAKSLCSAYGARLASYSEMEDAYNKGAEWCNYGWSANQMAFFPTQKSTWDKLQKTKNHKNYCGRPGVNGGYMKNPYIRFGVNCYGKKPKANDADLSRMNAKKNQVYPKTREDLLLDAKVQFWKDNADKLLKINSFNENKWSEY